MSTSSYTNTLLGSKTFQMQVPATNIVDGLPLFEASPEHHVRTLKLLPLYSGDVLVTGYPQSGIRWIQLALSAIQHHEELDTFDVNRPPCVPGPVEKMAPYSKLRRLPRPTVVWTHLPYDMLPIEVKTRPIRIVHVMRNPKDVAVAYYDFAREVGQYHETWHSFYDNFMYGRLPYGDWFQYVTEWNKRFEDNENIFPIKYEDFLHNPEYAVDDLALFMGKDLPSKVTKYIAEIVIRKIAEKDKGLEFDQSNFLRSLAKYLRQDRVGSWMRYFDHDQNRVFDMIYTAFEFDTKLKFEFD